jgi:hypothetical protein
MTENTILGKKFVRKHYLETLDAGWQEMEDLNKKDELFDKAALALKQLFVKPGDDENFLLQEINSRIYQMAQEIEIERLQNQINDLQGKIIEVKGALDHNRLSDGGLRSMIREDYLDYKTERK